MSIKYKGKTISGSPGVGVPPGGTADQILTKKSDANYDTQWVNVPAASEIYSTEETRIGTWIDGKPLYRRVITGTTGENNAEVYVDTGMSGAAVISVQGYLINDDSRYIAIPDHYTWVNFKSGYLIVGITGATTYVNRPYTVILTYTR